MKKNKEIDLTYFSENHKDTGFAVGLHPFQKGFETSYHWHDYYEMELIVEGGGTHVVNDKQYKIKRGDIHIITTADFHSLKFDTSDVKIMSMGFVPQALPTHIMEKVLPLGFSCVSLNEAQFKTMYQEFEFLMGQYAACPDIKENALLKNAFERVILLFLQYLFPNGQPKDFDKHFMPLQKVLTFVRQNYSSQITLEDAAAVAGMTTTYFSRYFKQNMNLRFVPYLNKVRCSVAAAFLSSTDIPIEEISARTGYMTASYFSKVFRSLYGQSPVSYRQQRSGELSSRGENIEKE